MAYRGFYLKSQELAAVSLEIKDNLVIFEFRIDRASPQKALPDFSSAISYLKMGPAGRGCAGFYAHDNAFGFSHRCDLNKSDRLIAALQNVLCPTGVVKDKVIHWVECELQNAKQNNPLKEARASQGVFAQPRKQPIGSVNTSSAVTYPHPVSKL